MNDTIGTRILKYTDKEGELSITQETIVSRLMAESSIRDAILRLSQLADNSSITQHLFDMKDLVTVFEDFPLIYSWLGYVIHIL